MPRLRIALILLTVAALPAAAQRQQPARKPQPGWSEADKAYRDLYEQMQRLNTELHEKVLKGLDYALYDQLVEKQAELGIAQRAIEEQYAKLAESALKSATKNLDAQALLLEKQYAELYESAWDKAAQERATLEALLESNVSERDAQLQRDLDRLTRDGPPESRAPQDPADSLWRVARSRFNRGEFEEARRLFSRIRTDERYARSVYRADAFYYEAFSLSRLGGESNLRQAQDLLGQLMRQFSENQRHADTQSLLATIQARLAQSYGNAMAIERVREMAEDVRQVTPPAVIRATEAAARASQAAVAMAWPETFSGAYWGSRVQVSSECREEAEIRLIALNALVRMDSASAMPVLREVMARRDECAPILRDRALFIISRVRTAEAEAMLADAARNDPDRAIRQTAVVRLSERNPDLALTIVSEQLRTTQDREDQEWALGALARMRTDRAWAALRDYAARTDLPSENRRRAIIQLGASRDSANAAFLRDLYRRAGSDRELKEAILMSSAGRRGDAQDLDWLIGIALNDAEDTRLREYAMNIVARSRNLTTDRVVSIYDRASEKRLRQIALRELSERARNDPVATDKLIAIARSEADLDLRKTAVMGLASVNDPRARELLQEILRR